MALGGKRRQRSRAWPGWWVSLLLAAAPAAPALAGEPACRTGGPFLAEAAVRSNPLFEAIEGSFAEYVAANASHFGVNGDAVKCARAMSAALIASAAQVFDPGEVQIRDHVRRQMEAQGLSAGPQQATLSEQYFALAMQMNRLARGLPALAAGDMRPYATPTNQLEELHVFAENMLRMLMADPNVRQAIMAQLPLLRRAIQAERQMLANGAARMAVQP